MSDGKFKFPPPDDVRRVIEEALAEGVLRNDRPVFRDLMRRPGPRGENPLTDYLLCDPPREQAEGLQYNLPPTDARPSERVMQEMRGAVGRVTFRYRERREDDEGRGGFARIVLFARKLTRLPEKSNTTKAKPPRSVRVAAASPSPPDAFTPTAPAAPSTSHAPPRRCPPPCRVRCRRSGRRRSAPTP